ncbi:hypothetical protein GY45DRAFT_694465 [Cubamyces sp. BRFM 1775]|nr:hypothetical protein GY45DRAFT_694465 [Cubamyces sp. BRFM 1775]
MPLPSFTVSSKLLIFLDHHSYFCVPESASATHIHSLGMYFNGVDVTTTSADETLAYLQTVGVELSCLLEASHFPGLGQIYLAIVLDSESLCPISSVAFRILRKRAASRFCRTASRVSSGTSHLTVVGTMSSTILYSQTMALEALSNPQGDHAPCSCETKFSGR